MYVHSLGQRLDSVMRVNGVPVIAGVPGADGNATGCAKLHLTSETVIPISVGVIITNCLGRLIKP